MTDITISPLAHSHLAHVAEVEKACFNAPWSETSLGLLLTGQNGGLVALDGRRAVGYIGYLCAVDEYEITNVAVSPDYRRRGIGEALLSALLSQARENGIVRITLDVRVSNIPATSLYQKLGFCSCGTRKNFYTAPREDAAVMELVVE